MENITTPKPAAVTDAFITHPADQSVDAVIQSLLNEPVTHSYTAPAHRLKAVFDRITLQYSKEAAAHFSKLILIGLIESRDQIRTLRLTDELKQMMKLEHQRILEEMKTNPPEYYVQCEDLYMKDLGFPSTLYVSSYYCENQMNVFNVLGRYMLHKTKKKELDLSFLGEEYRKVYSIVTAEEKEMIAALLREFDRKSTIQQRQDAERDLSRALDVDLDKINSLRMFRYCTLEELKAVAEAGVDLELHTHRHRMPDDEKEVEREIRDNQRVLQKVTPGRYEHLCYPSGAYSPHHLPWLKKLGIKSATTTRFSLNDARTPSLELDRFLDHESLHDLEFEANLCGVTHLLKV